MRVSSLFCPFLVLLLFWACSTEQEKKQETEACLPQPDISKIDIKVEFVRIDREIIHADTLHTESAIREVLQKHPLYNNLYLLRSSQSPQDIMLPMLASMAKEPYLDSLLLDYEKVINIPKLQEELILLFRNIKAYYPDFTVPKVYFSISGMGSFALNQATDVFLSRNNEILVIGLDWFLGPTYKYPLPEIIPRYIARRYVWQNIPSFVAQLISNRYNDYNTADQTMLNEMLGYAKTYYFAQSVVPCLADSSVLGYTSQQMDYIHKNKDLIWKHYLDKQVFFSTTRRVKKDYVDEGPFTLPISQDCPGAVARWTGLQMLKKYAEKKKLSLPQVMKITDAKMVLNESGYKGR
ncbi:MAG: hypothetical protein OHK0045_12630 [Raineya sp.]